MRRLSVLWGPVAPSIIRCARLRLRRRRSDSVESMLANAPITKEPLTDDEAVAMEEGRRAYLRGESSSLDDVRHDLLREPRPKKTAPV